jgi:hypothetical protein
MPSRCTLVRLRTTLLALAGCLLIACLARPAAGHGTPFSVGFDALAGKITVSPTIYRNFDPDELFVLLEPGLAGNDGTPGWDRGPTLPSGAALSVRFLEPLAYWNPQTLSEDPLPTPQGRVEIFGGGGTAEVAAASGQNPGGVSGTNPLFIDNFTSHHHVAWEILDPDAPGLYGLWARLESSNPAAFAAAPSDPFLVVLNWGITDSEIYNAGVDRLALTAVPEPSTLALLAATSAAVGWRWRWHHGRRVPVS